VNDEISDPTQFDRMFMAEAGKVKEISVLADGELPDIVETETAVDTSEVGTDTELLAHIPFFAGLDRSRLKLLAFTSERQILEVDEDLIRQGEKGEMAFVVVDGTFSIIAETPEGRVKISDIDRGGVIGELALLCEAPRTATVKANERSTVLKIDKDVFIQLIKDNSAVGENLSHILATKLVKMMDSMNSSYEPYDPNS
jgi:signal-transduction protein with cAMP-binding, CBS, and nucleotidyltransferase domain